MLGMSVTVDCICHQCISLVASVNASTEHAAFHLLKYLDGFVNNFDRLLTAVGRGKVIGPTAMSNAGVVK